MTELLLLSCRSPFLDDSKIYSPMANLYLKSYVNKHLPEVNVTLGDDNYDLNNAETFEKYDTIGVSIMTPQRAEATKILKTIKSKYPEKIVIAGGAHVKHYLDDVIKQEWDYVVPYDGEKALVQILQNQKRDWANKREFLRRALKPFGDLNVDPSYAPFKPIVVKSIMNKTEIADAPRPDRTSQNAIQLIKQYHYMLGDRKATTMMTARGCPERCTFCEDAMTPVK